MKIITSLIAFLTLTLSAQAYSTYDVRDYTCQELRQSVQDEGAIILKYRLFFGGTGTHYNNKTSCTPCFKPLTANVLSTTGMCSVGYKCIKKSSEEIKKENKRRRRRGQRPLRCR
jgi:hypothetical protein